MRPIVEPGPAQLLLVDLKPQRLDQPQLRPHRHAAPPDVARVRRNLRLIEDDVQQRGDRWRHRPGQLPEVATGASGLPRLYQAIPGRFGRFSERVLGPNATAEQQAELKASFDGLLKVLEAIGAKTAETAKTLPADKEEGFARLDALTRIGNAVFTTDMLGAKNAPGFDPWKNLAPITAPVKFPHTWNTSWFDWVQYDGSIEQPMVRNAGEAMGVSAKINLTNPDAKLYSSSIPMDTVFEMEGMLAGEYPLTPDPAKPNGVKGDRSARSGVACRSAWFDRRG